MEDYQFQRRGAAAAAAPLSGKVASGGRAKPAACYGDVFGGPPRSSLAPARPEDYREIFGAATACSIPVLDLPPPPGDGYELRQCSALDYLDIFGGFGGGDFAASYQELFFSRDSNGAGATPLQAELGGAAPMTGNSETRGLKEMSCKRQEMPASEFIIEGPNEDQVGHLLNGVGYHLNDDTDQLNSLNHMASYSKSDSVNRTIHKSQVHAIPGFAFVKNTEVDGPHTQADIDIFFDSNHSKGTSELQHLKKTMLAASFCKDVKYSVNDMKDHQRSSPLKISSSTSCPAYEENPSCSSENQSTVPRSNGFFSEVPNNHSVQENFIEKKTEGKCQNKTLLTCMSANSGNDLEIKCSASKDVPASQEHPSYSSNGHSASSVAKSSPDHLSNAKSSPNHFASDISIHAANVRIAETNHFKKSMSGPPPCTSSLSSEDKIAEQTKFNPVSSFPKDATANKSLNLHSSDTHSISSLGQSCSDGIFLTVSDINLQTQPSQGPPPGRPPPARPPSKSNLSGRNLRRTLTDYQKHDVGTGIAYKSHSFKQAVRDGSPPPFDVEIDASSAAAASVAAIEEAMELAQARLRSAKVSMERKKDNLQNRRKLGLNEDLRSINRNENETVQENRRSREEVVVQLACEKTDGQKNDFGTEEMATVCSPSLLTGDFREHGSAEECGLSNLPVKREEKVGEWKIEEQFYEFIQSEKKLKKVPEDSLKEGTEKRTNAKIGVVGEEPNTSELKESGKLLAASKVVEWEGDNGKLQNLSVTTKKQIKNSQEATLESCMLGDCNLKRKETVNAHHQEEKPGELQEPPETEQETKWRTSDEAFVCELSKNNLTVNNDVFNCKPVYVYQNPEKIQGGSDETSGCEETKQEINETEKYLEGHEEENDNIVWGKSSELDENKMEAKMTHVSHVSSKDIHLKTVSKNCEDENLKMSLKANEYSYFLEGQEIEPEEARLLFGQDNGEVSSFTHQAFEWAENGNELKATLEVHDSRSNEKKFNVVLGTNGCSSEAKRLKEIQKLPIETEVVQLKAVKQNTSSMEGIKDDFEGNITAAQKGYKKEINENIKEFQVVDSNKVAKTAQHVCKGTGNEKKIGDARQAISLGEQWCIYKAPHDSLGNRDAGWPVYNDPECHETGNVNGVKMESEQARNLEKEKEREKEGEVSKLEEKEREHIKLEDERHKKRIELEDETERERKLEEAKERERRRLKEEKERERRLEEEKEREWIRLEEQRERERKKLEEMERKKLQEERERKKLEDEEIEKKLADEVRERKKLDEEREKKKLEEERERKMLEEERERRKLEDEKKKLEEERERRRLEEEERERNKLEEERERRKLEDAKKKKLEEERERRLEEEERERRRLEEEEWERRRLEEEERERKQLEEAEERRKLEEEKKRKLEEERERKKLDEEERERMKIEEKEQMRKKQEEEDRERSKLEEKERERRKQEEERERRRLEEIERERRKLEEKVRERRRIEEEERERKLEEEKAKEKQKVEERAREKKFDEERDKEWRKREEERERDRKRLEEERDREREREKDRQAVERATREAHERAFAEARERAERAAVERMTAEARQRAMAEARERAEKASAETSEKFMADKASREARLRTERAAVERATAEARERAVEKAIADKAAQDARERAEKLATTSREGLKQSANFSNPRDLDSQFQNGGNSYQRHSDSSHHASFVVEKVGGSEGDSAIRCKARMERHQRTVERAAKALAEKNLRDIIAQREQAERNRLAETLDADVKRWSNGKEGNLRALLSTLQYILGPESGWQPIPLTDVVTAPAVKKAYRKATLWVHPDKLQQRGAGIQQKYICEKVFDLLKEAWNKFNSEER